MRRGRWLLLAAMLCAACVRAQNPQPPPAPPPRTEPAPPPADKPPAKQEGDPDDALLEFLGSDDVGDAAWWEFLKKSHPKDTNTAPPPDGKQ